MGMMKEFKEFAMRGNVVDMAVGIVIGGAFGKIVTSLVNDVVMPPIGQLLGGTNFGALKHVIQEATMEGETAVPEIAIRYGSFIQTIVDFLIIAFAIFMVVKAMNRMKRKKEEEAAAPPAPPAPSKEELLLTEIRDELRKRNT